MNILYLLKKGCLLILIPCLFTKAALSQAPFLVKNIHPSFTTSSFPDNLTNVNGTLYFSADDGNIGFELWKSDGTTVGTVLVKDLIPGPTSSQSIDQFISVNGSLYFMTKVGRELWRSSGTTSTTDTLITFPTIGTIKENSFIELNNELIFVVQDPNTGDLQLWKSGGTSSSTSLVKNFASGGVSIDIPTFKIFNNELYFTANDGVSGREVWRTDGTIAGTVMIKDIRTGSSDGTPWPDPPFFNEVDGFLFFLGNDGTTGDELWKTDGTNLGTTLVHDVLPGAGSSGITSPTSVGNKLFFQAFIGGRTSLWVSDGTSIGSYKIIELSLCDLMFALDSNTLIFKQDNTSPINYGRELWKSDGTVAGTVILKDVYPGTSNGIPTNHFKTLVIDETLYFNAIDSAHGLELWKSDGTDTGTVLVKDLEPGVADGFINNSEFFFDANGILIFDAININGSSSTELWRSDGSDTGTFRYDIDTNGGGSTPKHCTLIDTTLFFSANDGFTGKELYALYIDSIKKPIIINPTSVEDYNPFLTVNIFPNPTSNIINIQLETNLNQKSHEIKIMTLTGKTIHSRNTSETSISINLSDFPDGIYIIEVIFENNFRKSMKIIKN